DVKVVGKKVSIFPSELVLIRIHGHPANAFNEEFGFDVRITMIGTLACVDPISNKLTGGNAVGSHDTHEQQGVMAAMSFEDLAKLAQRFSFRWAGKAVAHVLVNKFLHSAAKRNEAFLRLTLKIVFL